MTAPPPDMRGGGVKVYVATWCRYSSFQVLAVFDRKEDADTYAEAQNRAEYGDSIRVQEVAFNPTGEA